MEEARLNLSIYKSTTGTYMKKYAQLLYGPSVLIPSTRLTVEGLRNHYNREILFYVTLQ